MRTDFFLKLHTGVKPHAVTLYAGTALLVLACLFFTSRLLVKEDVATLLPSSPPHLVTSFALLQQAPFAQAMTITVGGTEDDPVPFAKTLAAALQSDIIPHVITGPGDAFAPAALIPLSAAAPSLLPVDKMHELEKIVQADAIQSRFKENKALLSTAKGIALRGLVARDPLGISRLSLAALAHIARPNGMQVKDGNLVDATGQYAMIIAKPAVSMTDTAAAMAVMERFREARTKLPAEMEVILVGGHRYTESNADVIQADLARILPLSIGLLALLFFIFLRSWQGLGVFLVPLVAFTVACAGTSLVYSEISGIVIGFGSVLLGIVSDYPIHAYFAARFSPSVPEGLARVAPPLLVSACTTLAVFASFYISGIPGVEQMASFAIFGVAAAVLWVLLVFPLLLRTSSKAVSVFPLQGLPVQFSWKLGITWSIIALCLLFFAVSTHINGDIRSLSYASTALREDENRTREIWGGMREGALIVAAADKNTGGLEAALQINDAVWSILERNSFLDDSISVTSLAPLLPSQATQRQRHAAWTHFWAEHKDATLASIAAAAKAQGFSSHAFAPFAERLQTPPTLLSPAHVRDFGFTMLLDLLLRETEKKVLIFTLLPEQLTMTPTVLAELEKAGAVFISGQTFRDDISAATRKDIIIFCSFSLGIICLVTVCLFRKPAQCALVLFPAGASLAVVLGLFYCMQLPVTIFHSVAFPLIMTLSLDYGIFMVARQEGRLEPSTGKAILLSALTTISGFGCLVFADHPALFSLGITVAPGLLVAAVAALKGIPFLARKVSCSAP